MNFSSITLQDTEFNISEPEEGILLASGKIAHSNPYFSGHFSSFSVLPAVAQIEIMLSLLSFVKQSTAFLTEIFKSKYLEPIVPGSEIELELKHSTSSAEWVIKGTQKIYSKGKFSYELQ